MADKRRGDPLPLMLTGDLGVEEEGVIASVPCHVDEADQAAVRLAGGDPAMAVGPDLIPPSGRSPAAMCCDECHHFCAGYWPTPAVLNRLGHMADRPVSRGRRQQIYAVVLGPVLDLRPAASGAPFRRANGFANETDRDRADSARRGRQPPIIRPRSARRAGTQETTETYVVMLISQRRPPCALRADRVVNRGEQPSVPDELRRPPT